MGEKEHGKFWLQGDAGVVVCITDKNTILLNKLYFVLVSQKYNFFDRINTLIYMALVHFLPKTGKSKKN
jgi:hypothetical protein